MTLTAEMGTPLDLATDGEGMMSAWVPPTLAPLSWEERQNR